MVQIVPTYLEITETIKKGPKNDENDENKERNIENNDTTNSNNDSMSENVTGRQNRTFLR